MIGTMKPWAAVVALGGALVLGGCAESMSGDGMSTGSGTMMQDKGARSDKGMTQDKGATMEKR